MHFLASKSVVFLIKFHTYFEPILVPILELFSVKRVYYSLKGPQEGRGGDFEWILELFWRLFGDLGGPHFAPWGLPGGILGLPRRNFGLILAPWGTPEALFGLLDASRL